MVHAARESFEIVEKSLLDARERLSCVARQELSEAISQEPQPDITPPCGLDDAVGANEQEIVVLENETVFANLFRSELVDEPEADRHVGNDTTFGVRRDSS